MPIAFNALWENACAVRNHIIFIIIHFVSLLAQPVLMQIIKMLSNACSVLLIVSYVNHLHNA